MLYLENIIEKINRKNKQLKIIDPSFHSLLHLEKINQDKKWMSLSWSKKKMHRFGPLTKHT